MYVVVMYLVRGDYRGRGNECSAQQSHQDREAVTGREDAPFLTPQRPAQWPLFFKQMAVALWYFFKLIYVNICHLTSLENPVSGRKSGPGHHQIRRSSEATGMVPELPGFLGMAFVSSITLCHFVQFSMRHSVGRNVSNLVG